MTVATRTFARARIGAVVARRPAEVVTTDEIERRLAPVYDRLRLPAGRLELMTGIRERRFFPPGTLPGQISGRTVVDALDAADVAATDVDLLIHASVCRDQMEPATAAGVHHAAGLPSSCRFFDLSNACLGVVDGVTLLSEMVDSGAVRCGAVVGTETGRDLVEGTIDTLLNDPSTSRSDMKEAFASLTIGSGSAAVVVGHEDVFPDGHAVRGFALSTDTQAAALCAGGTEGAADGRPRMATDSEALLHAGVDLAERTWSGLTESVLEDAADRVVTHQVGSRHRAMLLDRLGLAADLDFPTVEVCGNTGSCALPTTAALASEAGHLSAGDRAAWLGIGSGLSCQMLAVDWRGGRGRVAVED